jgi:hypothetical protein
MAKQKKRKAEPTKRTPLLLTVVDVVIPNMKIALVSVAVETLRALQTSKRSEDAPFRDIMLTSPVSLTHKQRKCRHLAGDLNASRTAHPLPSRTSDHSRQSGRCIMHRYPPPRACHDRGLKGFNAGIDTVWLDLMIVARGQHRAKDRQT